ncbi:hypothetical protein [Embleya sp. NPDC001921]
MPADPTDNHHGPSEPLDVRTLVLLALTGLTVYLSYRDPALGVAIGVGIAVLLALHTLVKHK